MASKPKNVLIVVLANTNISNFKRENSNIRYVFSCIVLKSSKALSQLRKKVIVKKSLIKVIKKIRLNNFVNITTYCQYTGPFEHISYFHAT